MRILFWMLNVYVTVAILCKEALVIVAQLTSQITDNVLWSSISLLLHRAALFFKNFQLLTFDIKFIVAPIELLSLEFRQTLRALH